MKNSFIVFFVCFYSLVFANTEPKQSISFTENKGQVSDQNYNSRTDVLFSGSSDALTFHLLKDGLSYQLSKIETWKEMKDLRPSKMQSLPKVGATKIPDKISIYRIDIKWLNSNTNSLIEKKEELQGYTNYYLSSCPNGALNARSYEELIYKNIYNGIDLRFYNNGGKLKYDYILNAFADYTQIKFEIDGAEKIYINMKGELVIKTPLGEIIDEAPLVIQNGKELKAKWVVNNNVVGFEIPKIKKSSPFVIDPGVRVWGTYYGDADTDVGTGSSTDKSGNVYLTGWTINSTGTIIATSGSHQSIVSSGMDNFIVKFDSTGKRLWGTYYGGTGNESECSSATDKNENVYLAGSTTSTNTGVISTLGCHQYTINGLASLGDGFLVKFNKNGFRLWGTYYGGTDSEYTYDCAADANGNVLMCGTTGTTTSSPIASPGAHQLSFGGGINDAYVVKFDSTGVRQWGTYYGGNGNDWAYSCAFDQSGNVLLSGSSNTSSLGVIATAGSHQSSLGGSGDAFLVKFSATGVRQWGTYYGGAGGESGYGCATDKVGNIYLGGSTNSGNAISTPGAYQTSNAGGWADAFLVKFDLNGNRKWGTYYGGTNGEEAYTVRTDTLCNIFIAGNTVSTNGIATFGSHQTIYGGGTSDSFIAKFDSASTFYWGSYYGGSGNEETTNSCSPDNFGNIYFIGSTTTNIGNSIATPGSHQSLFGGTPGLRDAFLVKMKDCNSPNPPANITPPANFNLCSGNTTTLVASGYGTIYWYSSATSTLVLGSGSTFITPILTTSSPTTIIYYAEDNTCAPSLIRTGITVTVNPSPIVTASTSSVAVCSGSSSCLYSSGAATYTWVGPCAFVSTQQNPCFPFMSFCNCGYTVTGTDANGCKNTATICLNVNPNPTVTVNTSNTLICTGQTATLTSSGASTYTWSTSGTGSVIAISPTITTNYSVTGTDVNGCINSTSITQSVSACTEINQAAPISTELKIYPNPNNGEFVIVLNTIGEKTQIEIYNILSEVVLKRELSNLNTIINIGEFSNGIYVIKIYEDKQLLKTEKILKSQ